MGLKELPELLSEEDMKKHKIPLPYRDRCAALLVPLNKCRLEGWYFPWNCQHERHIYEECQYLDFKRRVKELELQKQQQKEE
ncbi:NB8M subunit of mitochondrial NADH:ubiquinone oxidoreductase (complex I), putative [Geotrichum candidum]|uniref:NADH dehydrogenase [ubiquinone] 1 beta subcomplex subunit 7 n=1 Tax=Geotrichum candidum TaxID=1173061 RepID=A0A0J9XD72_GEOCN|nr:NB8M subunit of mitochondrial NADH:ubiquinone oxidoreductase (complex I), putative [Geotrichum candidum]